MSNTLLKLTWGEKMTYKTLGNTEERIPAIGLGTWTIGGTETPDYSRDMEMVDIIAAAIEMGYTLIDTAEYYAAGHTEELIGEAIKPIDRSKLFITSKVWPDNLSRKRLHQALKRTLKRLGTDYLDLYLIHWPNEQIPLAESLGAMSESVDAGYVKYIGVSNFDLPLLEKAVAISKHPIVCNQVLYNVEDRQPQRSLLPYCLRNDVTLVAYSPVRRNIVSDRARRVLSSVAKIHRCSIHQVMLAWLIAQENVVTIPKSTDLGHLKDNLASADINLSGAELYQIDSSL